MEVNLTRICRNNNVQYENSTKEPAIVNHQIKGNVITNQRKCISSIPYAKRMNPNRIRYAAKCLHDLKKKQLKSKQANLVPTPNDRASGAKWTNTA